MGYRREGRIERRKRRDEGKRESGRKGAWVAQRVGGGRKKCE